MASFDSAFYALQKPTRTTTPTRLATENTAAGTIEIAVIPYTIAGTEATNDTVNLCILPAGAVPLPAYSKVSCSADPGSTLVLDVGTAADADGWIDGITLSSGGTVEAMSGTFPAFTAATPLAADTGSGNAVVYATLASVSTLTASVILYFHLAYKRGV